MSIIVEIPGVGNVEFENEEQATAYFKNKKQGLGGAGRIEELSPPPTEYKQDENDISRLSPERAQEMLDGKKDLIFKFDPTDPDNQKFNPENFDPYEGVDFENQFGKTALMNAADTYSAGVGPRGAAFVDALINKLSGKGKSVVPGGSKGIGDLYNDSRADQAKFMEHLNEANPEAKIIGDIGGIIGPGGVFSRAFKGSSKIPFISKLLGATKKVKKGGEIISKPAFWKILAGTGLRGGLANTLYGQVNQDFDASLADRGKKALKDFAIGGVFDSGTYAGLQGIKLLAKLPVASAKLIAKIPGVSNIIKGAQDLFHSGAQSKFADKIDDIAGATNTADKGTVGREFTDTVKKIGKDASDKYNSFVSENIKKYGGQKISVEKLRTELVNQLKSEGIIDNTGKIMDDSFELAFETDLRPTVRRLIGQLTALKENPTLADLETITKKIGQVAKFNKGVRGPKDKIFGSLYNAARESLFDGIEQSAIQKGISSKEYKAAKKALDSLKQKSVNISEAIDDPLVGSRYADEMKQVQSSIEGKVATQQSSLEGLVQKYEQEGLSAKEALQQARKNISQNIRISEGPIGDLAEKFPEEVITKAKGTGKLNLGSVVDEALVVNPAYQAPIKKAIMADIVDHAKDQRTLKKVLDVYKDVLPKILDKSEIDELMKLAGTFKKAPGAIKKSGSYFFNLLQGGKQNPKTIDLLPRSIPELINYNERALP